MNKPLSEKKLRGFIEHGRQDFCWFMTHALDVEPEHLWDKMQEVADSVRDNERTAVQAGHGVSKTFSAARISLAFLYCYNPATVVTTAPSGNQVRNVLWREIRSAHANSHIPLGGKLTTTQLDLQPETGKRWFATGFSTKPDTVTQEATAFQGYHNDNLLIIFDEAAGILPEIWRAAEHIGAPFKRFLAIGNATSKAGDFPAALKDASYNTIQISVTDTPNYKQGKTIIPGVYGKQYEQRIRTKYGEDSDDYKVRVLGEISSKSIEGAYYTKPMAWLEKQGRLTQVSCSPNELVYAVIDPGYTSAIWLAQPWGTDFRCVRYYEDSGVGIDGYAKLLREWQDQYGYQYGTIYVPCDMDSNAQRVTHGDTGLEILRKMGFKVEPLPVENHVVNEGIPRTRQFLHRCWIDKDACARGIECLQNYHEKKNQRLSTEDKPVFSNIPEKDGFDHGADAMRYLSMAAERISSESTGVRGGLSVAEHRQIKAKYSRTG